MPHPWSPPLAAACALTLALAACVPNGAPAQAPSTRRGASPATGPRASAPLTPKELPGTGARPGAEIVRLTGVVRLISDQGAKIISDNGGGVISNNGGSLISYALRAAGELAEWRLADADVTVTDARGEPVRGADGQPLRARTDQTGRYDLAAALPAGNHVLRVALWNGGALQALLVRPAAEASQDVTTASSLGAAYVLERLVKGEQAVFDRLAAADATRLTADLEAARGLLAEAPAYDPAGLAAAAEELRLRAPAVDATLTAIEAQLLGQAQLGDGLRGTEVPLDRPLKLAIARDGALLIDEYGAGRIRRLSPDGVIGTLMDGARGTIKRNVISPKDFLEAPDGSLYVASYGEQRVMRLAADGTRTDVFGADPAMRFRPGAIALGPDGTLYVGEVENDRSAPTVPRWVAVAPDGTARALPALDDQPGAIRAIEVAPDGTRYLLTWAADAPEKGKGRIYRVRPDGAPERLAAGLRFGVDPGLAVAPDGSLYVTEDQLERLDRVSADGTVTPLAGPATPFIKPTGLALAADGTLYVADLHAGLVYRRDPAGSWQVVAGTAGGQVTGDGRSISLNSPAGAAFDPQGRLLLSESGLERLVRVIDGRLEPIAGSVEGFAGDGGPATDARFRDLAGIVTRGDELLVLDTGNGRLRRIDAAGNITTLAGGATPSVAGHDHPVDAAQADLTRALGLVAGPAGQVYWTSPRRNIVERLGPDGRVTLLAGRRSTQPGDGDIAAALTDVIAAGEPAAEARFRSPLGLARDAAGDLLVADTGHGLIRKIVDPEGARPTVITVAGAGALAMVARYNDAAGLLATEPAASAVFVLPGGLCQDAAGNIYVGELGSRRLDVVAGLLGGAPSEASGGGVPARIRKITPDGQVTTIAGPGGQFFADPDAADALVLPTALVMAPDGRLVIVDLGANLVRILPTGTF